MSTLYLIILISSLIVPLAYTIFCRDVIVDWRAFFISTLATALPFLLWDAWFTHEAVWGFNDSYVIGLYVRKMPIEEILFFLVIPFCSLFIHYACLNIHRSWGVGKKTMIVLSIFLILIAGFLSFGNLSKLYTAVNFSFFACLLLVGVFTKPKLLSQFYPSFLIVLVPFVIVNGALTGFFSESPVVWYNNSETLGVRLLTIPIEDIGYAFSMLFLNLMIFDQLTNKEPQRPIL